jgi:hypothetical protein
MVERSDQYPVAVRYARGSVALEGRSPSKRQKDRMSQVLMGIITLEEAIGLALVEHEISKIPSSN